MSLASVSPLLRAISRTVGVRGAKSAAIGGGALKFRDSALEKKEQHLAEKILFGELVETSQQRRERLRTLPAEDEPLEPINVKRGVNPGLLKLVPRVLKKVIVKSGGQVETKVLKLTKSEPKQQLQYQTEKVMPETLPAEEMQKENGPSPGLETQHQTEKVAPETLPAKEGMQKEGGQTPGLETLTEKMMVSQEGKSKFLMPEAVVRSITAFPLLYNLTEPKQVTPLPSNDVLRQYPSVSKILKDTQSEGAIAALQNWRNRMIERLGIEGFAQYSKALLDRGSQFHDLVRQQLDGERPSIPKEMEGVWHSLEKVLPRVGEVRALEKDTLHPWLFYRGIIDCVASFDGKPMVIEWKKSDRKKPTLEKTFDAPVQLAAYMGSASFDPSCDFKAENGMVVVAYTDGSPADVFEMTPQQVAPHWAAWLWRVQQYWMKQQQPEKVTETNEMK